MSENLVRQYVHLQPGDRVKILAGPYAGMIGKIVSLRAGTDTRLKVRIAAPVCDSIIHVSPEQVEPWHAAEERRA